MFDVFLLNKINKILKGAQTGLSVQRFVRRPNSEKNYIKENER